MTYKILKALAENKIDDITAMERLAIDSEETLFPLMAQAHLPMPRLSQAETVAMVLALNKIAKPTTFQ